MSEQIEMERQHKQQRSFANPAIQYVLLISWIVYVFCLFPFSLESASLGQWILILVAGFGIIASAMSILNARYWKGAILATFAVLLVMYLLLWTKQLMDLGEAMPAEGVLELVRASLRTKQRLIAHFAENGNMLAAGRQIYWEAMPVLQAILLTCIFFSGAKRRGNA